MRTLWFGGSFNPIHHGHLVCARAVAEAGEFERIVLVPSAQPPHKPAATDLAAPRHRARMCELAVQGDALFTVDPQELHRTGPSYTFDTVLSLRGQGHAQVNWLIGADMVRILPSWHRAEQLLTEATFFVIARPGWSFDWSSLPNPFRQLEKNVLPAPLLDISATDIRRRIASGLSVRCLAPDAVLDYIAQERLYRA